MLSTSSVCPHKAGEIERLSNWGFDFVMSHCAFPSAEWENEIKQVHANGMKFIVRWPNVDYLSLTEKKYNFQAYDGKSSVDMGGIGISGPSHWNKSAEQIEIESLMSLVNMGIDGVLVNMITSDRPFPTNWYPFPNTNGHLLYWSFDDDAQEQWYQHSGGQPMPEIPHIVDGKCAEEQECFYRWYQDGWISKLIRLSEVATNAELKYIWTWLIPHTDWTMENMADGTADCIGPIEEWGQHVIRAGASPLVVVACHFPLRTGYPHWFVDGQRTIRELCNPYYRWDEQYPRSSIKLIIGAETVDARPNEIVNILDKHSHEAIKLGACGLFCGDTVALANKKLYSQYKKAFLAAKQVFDGGTV